MQDKFVHFVESKKLEMNYINEMIQVTFKPKKLYLTESIKIRFENDLNCI